MISCVYNLWPDDYSQFLDIFLIHSYNRALPIVQWPPNLRLGHCDIAGTTWTSVHETLDPCPSLGYLIGHSSNWTQLVMFTGYWMTLCVCCYVTTFVWTVSLVKTTEASNSTIFLYSMAQKYLPLFCGVVSRAAHGRLPCANVSYRKRRL